MTFKGEAIIFDLDGVLVDSKQVVEKHWKQWAEHYDLDPEEVLQTVHGRRTVDAIATLMPGLDAQAEAKQLADQEASDTDGLKTYNGIKETLNTLPAEKWAVATSGTENIARTRLEFAELPDPRVFITAEDVQKGKPDPEVYTKAAGKLGVDPSHCLVIEDTPAGIESALNAGMDAIAVRTTHDSQQLKHASAIVPTIEHLHIENGDGHDIQIRLKES